MDKEMEKFKADLLESVSQMNRGHAARTTAVPMKRTLTTANVMAKRSMGRSVTTLRDIK